MGLFVTFEGIEGSGKTTQLAMAADYLRKKGIQCLATSEPGGTGLGRELRAILLEGVSIGIVERSELLLFAADRAQHVDEVIIPALHDGLVVLCDRFSDATIAYQGYGRGLDLDAILMIDDFAARSLRPDYTLLFDIPPEKGLERVRRRTADAGIKNLSDDRFEGEDLDFHGRVRKGYLTLAEGEPDRIRIIDANGNIDEVFQEVRDLLLTIIGSLSLG
ncbi:MAG: dTMP kinase [Syntrophales bacterium]|nr:dTMP kinase [Syntrophales bacterium]